MIFTKYLTSKLPLAAMALTLFSASHTANAGLILQLADGTTTETIYDEDIGPSTTPDIFPGLPGAVGYIGTLGAVWDVRFAAGVGDPLIGSPLFPEISLDIVDVISSGAGTLTIKLTQTGNTASISKLALGIDGDTSGTVTQSYCLGSGVTEFGCDLGIGPTLGPFGPGAIGSSAASIVTPGVYDMTLITTITHGGAGGTFFGANLAAVPEPGMLTLLGLGLLGMGAISRRRKIA